MSSGALITSFFKLVDRTASTIEVFGPSTEDSAMQNIELAESFDEHYTKSDSYNLISMIFGFFTFYRGLWAGRGNRRQHKHFSGERTCLYCSCR